MTDPYAPGAGPGPTPPGYGQPVPSYGQPVPSSYGGSPVAQGSGPVGKVRSTGICILLSLVTLGVYSLYWYFKVHEEMKRHTGSGLGGVVAVVIGFFVGIVMPFITSSEVGGLYGRRGQAAPVSGATGLWYFPGIFILVGPLVWFIKTNGALNDYWRSVGAVG